MQSVALVKPATPTTLSSNAVPTLPLAQLFTRAASLDSILAVASWHLGHQSQSQAANQKDMSNMILESTAKKLIYLKMPTRKLAFLKLRAGLFPFVTISRTGALKRTN